MDTLGWPVDHPALAARFACPHESGFARSRPWIRLRLCRSRQAHHPGIRIDSEWITSELIGRVFACANQLTRIWPIKALKPTRYNGMMDTKEKLEIALREAIRAGDDVRKRSIRMVLAAVRQVEIDRQVKLDEAAVLSIIQKEIKTRKESVEEARRANRPDIVAATEAEIVVLQAYLPEALGADEMKVLVEAAIAEAGASSPADMGRVMKLLMPRLAGRAPGDQVSAVVRQLLQK